MYCYFGREEEQEAAAEGGAQEASPEAKQWRDKVNAASAQVAALVGGKVSTNAFNLRGEAPAFMFQLHEMYFSCFERGMSNWKMLRSQSPEVIEEFSKKAEKIYREATSRKRSKAELTELDKKLTKLVSQIKKTAKKVGEVGELSML